MIPIPVAPLANTTEIAAGQHHAFAVDLDGSAWAWGYGGALGYYAMVNTPAAPSRMPFTGSVLDTDGGFSHALFLKPDGTVWAAGSGPATELTGSGTLEPTPIANLSLVDNASLLTDADGDGVRAWQEYAAGTDPLAVDSNGNGLSDLVDIRRRALAANPDDDGDGVPNVIEAVLGTDPFVSDTDGDTVSDLLDDYPLDPTRTERPAPDPNDTTPPVINLTRPASARPVGGGGGNQ